ncbi:MAG: phage tail protein, partial [Pseudooceanicola atlanticus]
AKNLKYDRVHDEPESLGEVLSTICAAGRASPRHDGTKWSVVIDRQQPVAIDHINPRNYEAFTWSRGYFDPPDAFRVRFRDDSNDYNLAERIVPWPGHVGDIDLTEELVLPGKTDPDEIWIEARRRMYELLYRADRFSAVQDGSARVATRGDLVMASVDLLASTQRAARVIAVRDHLLEIDDRVEMSEGVPYAIRFRTYANEEDSIGISVVREVVTDPGERSILRLKSVADVPPVGRLIHFGPLASDSFALRVRGIEAGEDFSSILDMVADAPEIETLTDAEVPPAWNGRVGAEIGSGGIAPAAPRFVDVRTGTWGTGHPDGLDVIVAPGTGSAASVGSFEIDHKLTSAETWSMRSVPAAAAGTGLPGYSSGDQVDIRARAIATDGTIGPDSATLTVIIGAQDQPVPGALEASAITVTGGLGHALLSFATGADAELAQVQVYRVPYGATLDKAAHAVGSPFPVGTSSTVSYVDGDATRTSIVPNGSFDSISDWSGTDWTITDGRAWHEPEETGTPFLASVSADDGATYRWSIDVTGRTDGVVQPWMVGDTTASHSTISADGTYRFTLTAPANVVSLGVGCTGAFDGAIDNVIAYRETVACIGEGSYDYYLEPQNDLGGAGPVAGPFPAVII